MTDEEIEKAIQCCAMCLCNECPLDGVMGCQNRLNNEKSSYINRLKEQLYQAEQKLAECENGYQATLDLERRMRADDKERICKETAKEVLDEVSKHYGGAWLVELYKKYGVEVDE